MNYNEKALAILRGATANNASGVYGPDGRVSVV